MTMSDKDIFSWVVVLVIVIWTLVRLHQNHKNQSKERLLVFILYIGTITSLIAYQYFIM